MPPDLAGLLGKRRSFFSGMLSSTGQGSLLCHSVGEMAPQIQINSFQGVRRGEGEGGGAEAQGHCACGRFLSPGAQMGGCAG